MNIYQQFIMEHARNPRNVGRIKRADFHIRATNPFCGDEADIFLKLSGKSVSDIKFVVRGCILSKAALSIFSEYIKRKAIKRLLTVKDKDVFDMIGGMPTPSRQKCVTFGIAEMQKVCRDCRV